MFRCAGEDAAGDPAAGRCRRRRRAMSRRISRRPHRRSPCPDEPSPAQPSRQVPPRSAPMLHVRPSPSRERRRWSRPRRPKRAPSRRCRQRRCRRRRSQREVEVERRVRTQLTHASTDLNRIDYQALNTDARTQYDTAKRFVAPGRGRASSQEPGVRQQSGRESGRSRRTTAQPVDSRRPSSHRRLAFYSRPFRITLDHRSPAEFLAFLNIAAWHLTCFL